jgi:chemotaxis methyl-accepting protein methylase
LRVAGPDDPDGFAALTGKIVAEYGFRCGSYKERCLRRRIAVRMRARGVHTYTDYIRVLDADPREHERLLDALTINVTKLFRNPDTYHALARHVVPTVLGATASELRVWSAGCSSGEEPYSLAALFHAEAEASGRGDQLARLRILGSDIDRASLAAAELGEFAEAAFDEAPPELRRRYFTPGQPARALPELRRLVAFERRDLLRDPPPAGPFHLVVCRNVLIYFDRDSQERLFSAFAEALVPGGFLVLGKVESLLGEARAGFTVVDARERIFRRR